MDLRPDQRGDGIIAHSFYIGKISNHELV
jgi:hypothetical protein